MANNLCAPFPPPRPLVMTNQPPQQNTDRNLLFALLAFQNNFITRADLLLAFDRWTADKSRSIGDLLVEQQRLTGSQRQLIDALAVEHLKQHGDDPQQSLAALTAVESGPQALAAVSDPDLQQTLVHLGTSGTKNNPDPLATLAVSGSETNANGQRFQFLREHAEGGLGRVCVARDRELNREVALKEIKPSYADDPAARARFVLEAEVTGGLEHPGIVPVYGLGAYADGRPYYAMRFIRGDSLKTAIEDFYQRYAPPHHASDEPVRLPSAAFQGLEFRQLLSSFSAVCQAVAYAHARGVLHRDLKPANIMLGNYGETLVVDWGLAKATGKADPALDASQQPLTAASSGETSLGSAETLMGSTIGTLGYMSPEQADGRVDLFGPGTDIYLLGATLYHLLTGQPPHRLAGKVQSLQRIRRNEFPPPRAINSLVPGGLQAIALRAMAALPEERYESARALAQDIAAWLADEPVAAAPDRALDRAWRWTRRNRSWAISGVVSLALVALVAVAAVVSIRAAQRQTEIQRQTAIARLREAREAVDSWQTGTSELLRHYPGVQRAREHLLTQAAAAYDKFAGQVTGDDDLELERARAYLRRGDVERSLQKSTTALTTYAQAQELLTNLQQRNPERWEISLDLARMSSKTAVTLADQGKSNEGIELLEREIKKISTLAVPERARSEAQEVEAILLLNCGRLTLDQGRVSAAEPLLARAHELLAPLAAKNNATSSLQRNRVAAVILLGEVAQDRGQPREAAARFAAAVETLDRLVAAEPDHPDLRQIRATACIYHASACRSLGQVNEELAAYEAALASYRELARAIPDDPQYADSAAITELDLAALRWQRGQSAAAIQLARQARQHFAQRHQAQPDWHDYRARLATASAILGPMESSLGEREVARDLLTSALQEFDKLIAAEPQRVEHRERRAVAASQLAHVLSKRKESAEARTHFASAIADLAQLATEHPQNPRLTFELAHACTAAGAAEARASDEKTAAQHFTQARDLWRRLIAAGADVEHLCEAAWFFANCPQADLRNSALAATAAAHAVAAAPEHPQCAQANGIAAFSAGNHAGAIERLQRAQSLRNEPHFVDAVFLARAQQQAGDASKAQSQLAEAERLFTEYRPDDPEVLQLLEQARAEIGVNE